MTRPYETLTSKTLQALSPTAHLSLQLEGDEGRHCN